MRKTKRTNGAQEGKNMKTTIALLALVLNASIALADYGTPTPTPVAVEPKVELTTVTVNDEGEHLLADTKGNTLYVFDLDQGKPAPTCSTDCAEVWPPYLISASEAKNLVAPLGSIARANKKVQVTYEGRPVYTYAFDRGVAADAGDDIGGVWHYIELEEAK